MRPSPYNHALHQPWLTYYACTITIIFCYHVSLIFCTGVAVGIEFCHAESLPVTDPTLWTFMIVESADPHMQYNSIIITTVCTVLAFILGIICGVIVYCSCHSALKNRENEQHNREENTIYDEIIDHHSGQRRDTPTVSMMEFNRNIAYGQAY